ncbi:Gfo/Idh/MocA family oxidoreductase [Sphingomonas naphthae]|uniref:Gfo/Idh/MocA family oxidoreductase n=1 Tax=Sphingomonas naphthae TaxID=1813468 RepID=A0ABY7TJY7_9SPHN|nr:Gfo/Idh/MocA family oxidoreductase [Sphingomonas naphthae]WCT73091.1 Gfo/Idh/MocA family oxidoreductase [Sphingomonas naphthae]
MTLGIGVVGCGAISESWFAGIARGEHIRAIACAARSMDSAHRAAATWGIDATDVATLLTRPDVDVVLILTPPASHFALAEQALRAGKHAYLEKPVTPTAEEARALIALSAATGRRVGCAPDTFLGAAHQAARAVIDVGGIGQPVGGALTLQDGGPNVWLATPEPLFAAGMGPVRDMAPYYLTHMVCLLGACRRVEATATHGPAVRTILSGPRAGVAFPVETPTSYAGTLTLASGAIVRFAFSWDEPDGRKAMEIAGTTATLSLPNPNWFGGEIVLTDKAGPEPRTIPLDGRRHGEPNHILARGDRVADYRGAGLDDMAAAILAGRPHRTDLTLAAHVLDIVEAILSSAATGRAEPVASDFTRPAPLD